MNKTQKAMAATDEAVPAPVEDKAAAYRPDTKLEVASHSPSGGLTPKKFFNRQDVERMQKFEQDFSVFLTALNDIELLLTNRLSEVQDMQKSLKVFQR